MKTTSEKTYNVLDALAAIMASNEEALTTFVIDEAVQGLSAARPPSHGSHSSHASHHSSVHPGHMSHSSHYSSR